MSIAIIGIGNLLLKDEGVGVHAINKIKEEYIFSPSIDLIDGGTLGLDLLPYFEKYSKILIIDAVNLNEKPGTIKVFDIGEIPLLISNKFSVHHIGLTDILTACRLLKAKHDEIKLIGIQPHSIDFGIELSRLIMDKIDLIIDQVIHQLQKWGVRCVSRSHQRLY
ncbi:MAG: HyaD/HybD family hydrogenase maturation endopeptidase [Thermodesulfovibrionales bacterium]|nr:HyaD/HybD family hydrogenase maturation endopeptidase [Thermodesulfovibrionales bacterium]